jgi:hypothetical protein
MNRYANAGGRVADPRTDEMDPLLLTPDGRYCCDACDSALERSAIRKIGEYPQERFVCEYCAAEYHEANPRTAP